MVTFLRNYEETLRSVEPTAVFQKVLLFTWFWEFSYRAIRLICPVLKNHEKHSPERFLEVASIKANTAFHALVIGPMSAYALLSNETMLKIVTYLRAFDTEALTGNYHTFYATESDWLPILTPLSVAFFIWELIYLNRWEVFDLAMVFHHVFAIVAWPLALCNGLANFFLLAYQASELSSPLIHIRWFARTFFGTGALWMFTTLTFALLFTAIRVVTIPHVLVAYMAARPWEHEVLLLSSVASFTLVMPIILNTFWFILIAQMGAKMVCPKKKKA
jgi:hypothetical protein